MTGLLAGRIIMRKVSSAAREAIVVGLLALGVCSGGGGLFSGRGAWARPAPVITTSFGQNFVTVGAPGNREMLPVERYYNFNSPTTNHLGAVSQPFRIAQTEVTVGQWQQFISLAYPVWREIGGGLSDGGWVGNHMTNLGSPTNPVFVITSEGNPNQATTCSWRAAAMYCNWLCNGRPTGPNVDLNVFRNGAYDVSTFRRDSPNGLFGPFLDQAQRNPGAQYWIPNVNEWAKAAYYDPDRYAPGNPGPYNFNVPGADPPITGETAGYWLYPNQSQDYPGQPGQPGQALYGGPNLLVGSFPATISPWGALDMLGGVTEWTETVIPSGFGDGNANRWGKGNGASAGFNDGFLSGAAGSFGSGYGFRIASLVPAPASGVFILLVAFGHTQRRKRMK